MVPPHRKGVYFFRNHRKLLLVDDRIAYIGGMNIAMNTLVVRGESCPWRDNMVEIAGPEVAMAAVLIRADVPRAGSSLQRLLIQMQRQCRRNSRAE